MKEEIDERLKLLASLLKASHDMIINHDWPVTEEELIKYHDNSFEFGFACGALWQRNHVWHDISEKPTEPKATTMIDNKYWCYLEDIIPTNK